MDDKDDKKGDRKIEIVRFDGDELETLPGGHVVLKPMCRALGLDARAQQRRIQRQAWAGAAMMAAPDARGCIQEHFCLHVTSVHMWLATIDANRVKPEVHEKLVRYQREAAQVLAAHFMGTRPAASSPDLAVLAEMLRAQGAQLAAQGAQIAGLIQAVANRPLIGSGDAGIGAARAKWAMRMVREHARFMTLGRPKKYRTLRKHYEGRLRDAVQHTGVGSAWELLPLAKWDALTKAIATMQREAEHLRMEEPRQSELSLEARH